MSGRKAKTRKPHAIWGHFTYDPDLDIATATDAFLSPDVRRLCEVAYQDGCILSHTDAFRFWRDLSAELGEAWRALPDSDTIAELLHDAMTMTHLELVEVSHD